MNRDQGRGYHWLSSSPSDVKLSVVDYFRMVDVLRDERFSPEGLIKMKNMYEMTMMSMSMCILLSPIPALGASYLFSCNVRKSHSGYRYFYPLMAFFLPFSIWRMSNVEVGRRLTTEIFADDGEDGAYIRRTLKEKRPGLWRGISHQLYSLGYNFPEIDELKTNTEFPVGYTKL